MLLPAAAVITNRPSRISPHADIASRSPTPKLISPPRPPAPCRSHLAYGLTRTPKHPVGVWVKGDINLYTKLDSWPMGQPIGVRVDPLANGFCWPMGRNTCMV